VSATAAAVLGLSPDRSSLHRHRERGEATQGGAPAPSVALLDRFAWLAETAGPMSSALRL